MKSSPHQTLLFLPKQTHCVFGEHLARLKWRKVLAAWLTSRLCQLGFCMKTLAIFQPFAPIQLAAGEVLGKCELVRENWLEAQSCRLFLFRNKSTSVDQNANHWPTLVWLPPSFGGSSIDLIARVRCAGFSSRSIRSVRPLKLT